MKIRTMKREDYDQVYQLWSGIKGFAIRSLDDSREGVEKFLNRNPLTSVVAENNGKIVGSILCGHDGRHGCMYHVCVEQAYRKHGVGYQMVLEALNRLQEEGINKVNLIAFGSNAVGNEFWNKIGWSYREDLNYYDYNLNEQNITKFIK